MLLPKISHKLATHFESFSKKFIPFEYHPLFTITIFLILGISWWASSWTYHIPLALALCSTGFVLVFFPSKKIILNLAVALGSFTAGAGLYQNKLSHLSSFEKKIEETQNFTATVEDIQSIETPKYNFKTTLWLPKEYGRIIVFTKKKPRCEIGDTISCHDLKITRVKNKKFRLFLLKENIHGCVHTTILNLQVIAHPRFHFFRLCGQVKDRINRALKNKLDPSVFALWKTLFLGDKQKGQEMQELKESCQNWGISHYLARSGLHLMIFIYAWFTLLKGLPVSNNIKQIILLILVILYALLSTLSISFNRALITFLLYKFCTLQRFEIRPLHMVCLAAVLTLISTPAALFFLDFQLSYGLTAALAFFFEVSSLRKFLLAS